MVVRAVRKMEAFNEAIAFLIPPEQFAEFFGTKDEFHTYIL